jgi:hypothetical protein
VITEILRKPFKTVRGWVSTRIDTAIIDPAVNDIEKLYTIGTMWPSKYPRLNTWEYLNSQMPAGKRLPQADLEKEFRSRQSNEEKLTFETSLLDRATEAILSDGLGNEESRLKTQALKKGLTFAQTFLSAKLSNPGLSEPDRTILQSRYEYVRNELKKLNLKH